MIDVTKMVSSVAKRAEIKRAVRILRRAGVGDLIAAIGLVPRLSAALVPGVFAAGAVFGAAAALVLTPRTREAFKKDVNELLDTVKEKLRREESYGRVSSPSMS